MISGKYSIVLPLCALVTLALATFINSTSLHDSELVHQQEASEKSDQDNINEALDALINRGNLNSNSRYLADGDNLGQSSLAVANFWSPNSFRGQNVLQEPTQHRTNSESSMFADPAVASREYDAKRSGQVADPLRDALNRFKRNFYQNRLRLKLRDKIELANRLNATKMYQNQLYHQQRLPHASKQHSDVHLSVTLAPVERALQPTDLVRIFQEDYDGKQKYANSNGDDCALRKFRYLAQNKDEEGNFCRGPIEVSICSGSCVTSEYPDYTIPYKRAQHRSCNFEGKLKRHTILNDCSSPFVEDSLRVYRYFEPIQCKCKTCESNQTLCLTT